MVVIQPSSAAQITVPSRKPQTFIDELSGAFIFDALLINESTREQTVIPSQSGQWINGQIGVQVIADFKDSEFYYLVAYQADFEIVKCKIFCTSQTDLENYRITEGQFKEAPQGDNGFVILD